MAGLRCWSLLDSFADPLFSGRSADPSWPGWCGSALLHMSLIFFWDPWAIPGMSGDRVAEAWEQASSFKAWSPTVPLSLSLIGLVKASHVANSRGREEICSTPLWEGPQVSGQEAWTPGRAKNGFLFSFPSLLPYSREYSSSRSPSPAR